MAPDEPTDPTDDTDDTDDAAQLGDLGVGLDDLIKLVRHLHPGSDELERLSDAVVISQRLGDLGDHLIGHFVDQARHAGCSWREIGESMGVTKQAAQKRFVPDADDLPRVGLFRQFTPRARRAIDGARVEAGRMRSKAAGTEHLVLGLMAETDGIAARAVEAQGVTEQQVRDAVGATKPTAATAEIKAAGRITFDPDTKKVLEMSVRQALNLGHNYIGTEHLLLAVLAFRKSAGAKALIDLGVVPQKAEDWVKQTLASITKQKGPAA